MTIQRPQHIGAFAHLGRHIDKQIDTLPGGKRKIPFNLFGLRQRHAIIGHRPPVEPGKRQHENPRVGRIDQAQAQAVALFDIRAEFIVAVRHNEITTAACVTSIMRRLEIRIQLGGFRVQQPIIHDQNLVAVNIHRDRLFDDQRAMKAARYLFKRPVMGVKPIRAGIGHDKIILKRVSRRDSVLGQPRDSVHRVRDPYSVPVHRTCLWQCVDKLSLHAGTLLDADCRPGHHAIVSPDICLGIAVGGKLHRGGPRGHRRKPRGLGHKAMGRDRRRRKGRSSAQELPSCLSHSFHPLIRKPKSPRTVLLCRTQPTALKSLSSLRLMQDNKTRLRPDPFKDRNA